MKEFKKKKKSAETIWRKKGDQIGAEGRRRGRSQQGLESERAINTFRKYMYYENAVMKPATLYTNPKF